MTTATGTITERAREAWTKKKAEDEAQSAKYAAEQADRNIRELVERLKDWFGITTGYTVNDHPTTDLPMAEIDGVRFTLADSSLGNRFIAEVKNPCGKDHWRSVAPNLHYGWVQLGALLEAAANEPCDTCEYNRQCEHRRELYGTAPQPQKPTVAEQLEGLIRGIAREEVYNVFPGAA